MNPQWIARPIIHVPDTIMQLAGGNRIVAQRLADFDTSQAAQAFLNPDYYRPTSAFDLPDMEKAVARIQKAIVERERICIWGDFDVDGQTSTALLVSALRSLSADVVYYIPHREQEGHGIHIPQLASLLQKNVSLVLTCDTGITAHTAVNFANDQGVDVIVTDHHQLMDTLPDALAVINPQRLDSDHPLYTLPGVGCAYKLIEALYERTTPNLDTDVFLDLVALGIVADVAVQVADTRYLLQRGLEILRHTSRSGIQMLYEKADIHAATLDEDTIGFEIAPRLNAVGRLADANMSVELLTSHHKERLRVLLNQLEGLNAQRRNMTTQVYEAAKKQLDDDPSLLNYEVLVLSHTHWPGGIVGIVANRLAEEFNRPVVMLITPEHELARGSARSIEGCNITEAIKQQADLLNSYGGHSMAAGLSLATDHIPQFRRRLSRAVGEIRSQVDRRPILHIDDYVLLDEITPEFFEALQQLAPFGAGNTRPVLATTKLSSLTQVSMGRNQEHHRIKFCDEAGIINEVVWWRSNIDAFPKGRFDLVFTLHNDDYHKEQAFQLQYVDARPVDEEPQEFAHRSKINIYDYRTASDKLSILQSLSDVLIWAEGEDDIFNAMRRDQLIRSSHLVIWTAPSDSKVLARTLEEVNPETVYLFGVNPKMDSIQGFIHRLTGLVKYVLSNQESRANLMALASALAHNTNTIRAGLDWLSARGHVFVAADDGETILLTTHGEASLFDKAETTTKLASILAEAAAYRAFFQRADANTLLLRGFISPP